MKEEKINLFEISLRHKSMLHKEGLNVWEKRPFRKEKKEPEEKKGKPLGNRVHTPLMRL